MVFQALRKKMNKKGFTLIELMIVIAIIGILAAIAVPQFLSYRIRSFNSAAKAVVHNLKADNGNLNAELGVYGHTENSALDLAQNVVAVAATSYSTQASGLDVTAQRALAGARLGGIRNDGREHAVGVSLGRDMHAFVADSNDANDDSVHHTYARHNRGDTAYGIDSDLENMLFSVSDASAWPNSGTADFVAQIPGTVGDVNDLDGQAGGGSPTTTWERSN